MVQCSGLGRQVAAAQFSQIPDICQGDEGCHDKKNHPKQASDVHGIPKIRLMPFGLFGVFRMSGDQPGAALLQDIEDGDPIFACGFHANVLYALIPELLRHTADITVCRMESLNVKERFQGIVLRFTDSSH